MSENDSFAMYLNFSSQNFHHLQGSTGLKNCTSIYWGVSSPINMLQWADSFIHHQIIGFILLPRKLVEKHLNK